MARLKSALETAANVAMVVLAGVSIWMFLRPAAAGPDRPGPKLPTELLSLDGAQTLGSETARIALVVFSDFQCPYCASFATSSMVPLVEQYVTTGKVLLVFRHAPNEQSHPQAIPAAKATTCAGRQGKFWPVHDGLFKDINKDPRFLTTNWLPAIPVAHGLDAQKFQACMDDPTTEASVRADMSIAKTFITGTPTIVLGRREPGGVKAVRLFAGTSNSGLMAKELEALLK